MRVAEEQARLTLHAHFLAWLHGHQNIEAIIKSAKRYAFVTIGGQTLEDEIRKLQQSIFS